MNGSEKFGKIAYEASLNTVLAKDKAYPPPWEHLRKDLQKAWIEISGAVIVSALDGLNQKSHKPFHSKLRAK